VAGSGPYQPRNSAEEAARRTQSPAPTSDYPLHLVVEQTVEQVGLVFDLIAKTVGIQR
jgi:hypothetical protein